MFDEDLADFFDVDDGFAVTATWSGSGGAIEVIFENEYYETLGIAGRQPMGLVRDEQLPGLATGQTLTISATVYTVVNVEPDGTGVTRVRLRT